MASYKLEGSILMKLDEGTTYKGNVEPSKCVGRYYFNTVEEFTKPAGMLELANIQKRIKALGEGYLFESIAAEGTADKDGVFTPKYDPSGKGYRFSPKMVEFILNIEEAEKAKITSK